MLGCVKNGIACSWFVIYPMPGNNATLDINFTDLTDKTKCPAQS